jgi:hypothetical protein
MWLRVENDEEDDEKQGDLFILFITTIDARAGDPYG